MFSLGGALESIFGGKNRYDYQTSPFLGSPGSTPQEQYEKYYNTNRRFDRSVDGAMDLKMPQNVLNFNAANQTMGQQQGLIDQILAQGRGEGPNPAMDQLRMTTDQNARSAAGLAASQRGVNPALAARMAGQQMTDANQQAAGQGALMSAQQQIAAQQLGGGLLGQQIGQQMGQATAQGQAGLGLMQTRLGAEAQRRQAQQNYQNMVNQAYQNQNAINAGVSAQNAQTTGMYGQGAMSGISSAAQAGAGGMYEGGEVPNPFRNHVAQKLAGGGTVGSFLNYQQDPMSAFQGQLQSGNSSNSNLNKSMAGISTGLQDRLNSAFASDGGIGSLGQTPSLGGMQGESAIGFGKTSAPAWQGASLQGNFGLSEGGKVLGTPQVKGDSEKNDIVPAMLSPGEVVIPRTAMESPEDAHAFLDRIIQKNEGPSYKSILEEKEKYHNMAHGGEIKSCTYCHGGMA